MKNQASSMTMGIYLLNSLYCQTKLIATTDQVYNEQNQYPHDIPVFYTVPEH